MVLATVFQMSFRHAVRTARHPVLDPARRALARAEIVLCTPVPVAPRPVARAVLPPPASATRAVEKEALPSEEQLLQEINGCKTLLLEIVRRAAYDWVLYRASRRLIQRALAEQSYNWLFIEEPGTEEWAARMEDAKYITSFVGICESLDLDPDVVRGHIRRLTPKNVVSVGRPAEYRQRDVFTAHEHMDGAYALPSGMVDMEALAGSDDDTIF